MALVLLALCALSRDGAAQPTDQLATAETLFREAQTLFDAGRIEEACPKFQASYDRDPGLGALLNLARCYERLGKTATAWALYLDLENLAGRAGQADRAAIARRQIAALEPKLIRLAIVVPDQSRAEGLTVTVDERPIEPPAWGIATPRDPGSCTIVARARGKRSWSHTLELGKIGETTTVTVPPLADAPAVSAPEQGRAPTSPAPEPTSPAPSSEGDALRRTLGFVIGGVGVAALVVAAALAGDAARRWSDAGCVERLCPTSAAQSDAERALVEANVATGFVVGGSVALGVGAILVLTSLQSEPAPTTAIVVSTRF